MNDEFVLTWDANQMVVRDIHAFLTSSYWATGISLERVQKSMQHSLSVGVLHRGRQVAFARVVTDRTTFAYLADVFVVESERGKGLADRMMRAILSHAELKLVRRFLLFTKDAHRLYAKHGFKPTATPERIMEIKAAL